MNLSDDSNPETVGNQKQGSSVDTLSMLTCLPTVQWLAACGPLWLLTVGSCHEMWLSDKLPVACLALGLCMHTVV
jgi:hypothetical protein